MVIIQVKELIQLQNGILRDTVRECFDILAKHKYDVGQLELNRSVFFFKSDLQISLSLYRTLPLEEKLINSQIQPLLASG